MLRFALDDHLPMRIILPEAPADLIPSCNQTASKDFPFKQAQAEACGYKKTVFERNLV